ncbi:KIN14B-interacting protein At4g14310-like [Carya illinoinensis]|uniref:KIN14B-interacting protein At4g14310-like n=1 Tax=Carya illinoinensis TaxID=32201 RepID=UPI001C72981C|nr:KIN14B-interacting protein At4g14310-like [Carya illinoinensis]XP_042942602.1 KIN14B-interacting protein At4g14310-like [Carya illinoinensis]XP_042942605.1 KIN14B-interacting protein At4g14310-like [Carya illinoinensis]
MSLNKVGVLENCNGEVNLSLNLIKSSEAGLTFDEKFQDGMRVDKVLKSNEEVFKVGNGVDLYAKESGGKSLDKGTVSKSVKQKKLTEGIGGRFDIEYPSKLHEKLALLEGKVKRIALDIERTKEMLDRNNLDASKLILSDIQAQISGVQKVMGNVRGESGGKMAMPKKKNDGESGIVEKGKSKMVDNAKNFVKGLTSEELKPRLLPYHKLPKNGTYLKAASKISQSHEPHVVVQNCVSKEDRKSFSPIHENHISVGLLASLNKGQK